MSNQRHLRAALFPVFAAVAFLGMFLTAPFVNATKPFVAASPSVFIVKTVDKPNGDKMVDFSWQNGGKSVKLSELAKGKPIFINFWATWCPPCRAEIPDIIKLSKEFGSKVTFVGISLDEDKTDEKVLKLVSTYTSKTNMPYINIIDPTQILAKAYGGVGSIPTTFIVDKNGKIIEKIEGMRSEADFRAALKKVL